jgi:AdoMet-dependent heme synthase
MKETQYEFKSPAFVQLDLTRHCNLDCFYCNIRDNNSPAPASFPLEHFKTIIDRLVEAEVFSVSFFGGEPFLYPHIYELAEYAKGRGLNVSFLSNGTLIKEEDVGRIPQLFLNGTLALNGLEQCHNKAVRTEGMFQRTANILKRLSNLDFPVGIDTVIFASNVTQLESFLGWVSENIPRVRSIFVNFYIDYDQTSPQEVLTVDQMNFALGVIDGYNKGALKNKIHLGSALPLCIVPKRFEHMRKSCSAGTTFCAVDVFGNVKICSWSHETLGNLFNHGLSEIWTKSDKLQRFRSLSWLSGEACASCGLVGTCQGGCKVTSTEKVYSVDRHWRPFLRAEAPQEDETKTSVTASRPDGTRYMVNKSIRLRREEGGYSLYIGDYNRCYWCNETSLQILELIKEGLSLGEVMERILEEYEVEESTARESLNQLVLRLEVIGAIVNVVETTPFHQLTPS